MIANLEHPHLLAVSAAMRWEIQPILRALGAVQRFRHDGATVWVARHGRAPVIVFRTGMGQERAAAATRAVLGAYPVRAVINSGCAGALIPGLRLGAVVVPELVFDATRGRAAPYATDAKWVERLLRATDSAGLPAHRGPVHSTDDPLTTPESKRAAHGISGAAAVDMEGAAVAGVARERGVAFAAVRSILDDVETRLPAFPARENTDGLIARFKLNSHSVALPANLAPLFALSWGVKAVRTALHAVFRSLFEPRDEFTKWFEITR